MISPIFGAEYRFDGESNEWSAFVDQLPTEIKDELEDFTADNLAESADSLSKKLGISYWLGKITDELLSSLLPSLKNASSVVGVLLLISSVNLLSENLCSTSSCKMFTFCGDICVASAIVSVSDSMLELSSAYLTRLCGIMNILIPASEAILLTEGAVTQLAVHRSAMLLYIGITSNLNKLILAPMIGVLFAFAVSGTVFQPFGINGFIQGIKKFVMIVISLFTMLFSFILGLQTVLAKSADTLGLKTARLALGSFIPIIGGTLSEALTTVKEGFGVIRNVAGIGGIFIILLLVLPVSVSLFTNNLILSFCHMTAEILGCSKSAEIISGIQAVLSILSAIVYATSLLFIMAMVLFAKVGGGV